MKGDLLKTNCVFERDHGYTSWCNQNSGKEVVLVVSAHVSILTWLQIVVICGFISKPHRWSAGSPVNRKSVEGDRFWPAEADLDFCQAHSWTAVWKDTFNICRKWRMERTALYRGRIGTTNVFLQSWMLNISNGPGSNLLIVTQLLFPLNESVCKNLTKIISLLLLCFFCFVFFAKNNDAPVVFEKQSNGK